jgi:uncharacterized protein
MNESNLESGPAAQEERTWGMLAHLSAFAGLLIPLGFFIGPLVIWLTRREQSPFVDDQGREALNFNISVLLAGVVCGALVFVFIGFLLIIALGIYWIIMTIVAGIKAGEGVRYRYPLILRLVK